MSNAPAPVGGSAKRQDRVDGLDPKDEHAVPEGQAPTLNLGSDTARDALTKAAEAFREAWPTEESLAPFVGNAALEWCGKKERETFPEDVDYFKENWWALTGLRAQVIATRNRELAELCEAALTTLKTYEQGVEDAAKVAEQFHLPTSRLSEWLQANESAAYGQRRLIAAAIRTLTQTSPDHDRRGR